MQILKRTTNFEFMRYWHWWGMLSVLILIASAVSWVQAGNSKWGVDFAGGVESVVKFEKPISIGDVRGALDRAQVKDFSVQAFENAPQEFSVRLADDVGTRGGEAIKAALKTIPENSFQVLKEDVVGPVIGDQIKRDGVIALVLGLIGIMIYISVRFEWPYALGAVVALLHDVLITAGAIVLSGRQFNGPTLAALLTIIGYSVNDTIIIFDRIRENISRTSKDKKRLTFPELVNLSVNQTLSRTLLTSLTVFFSALMLWILGTGAVAELGFAFTIGTIAGTYSTVFIACPVVHICRQFQKDSRSESARVTPARGEAHP